MDFPNLQLVQGCGSCDEGCSCVAHKAPKIESVRLSHEVLRSRRSASLLGDKNLPFMQKSRAERNMEQGRAGERSGVACVRASTLQEGQFRSQLSCECLVTDSVTLTCKACQEPKKVCKDGTHLTRTTISNLTCYSTRLQSALPVSQPTLRPWPCHTEPAPRSTTIHFVSTPAEPEVVTARNRLTGEGSRQAESPLGLVRASEIERE